MRPAVALLLVGLASAFVPPPSTDRSTALEACRRNTKKEKRQRNLENMRKFKQRPNGPPFGRGKKKALSRKKQTLKAQAAKEKEREAIFMSRLFQVTDGPDKTKLDLGVL
ncbi:hypothetical protein CTAYLR_006796 [Chrysophaeum taylorii]|uniref:Uncharacterized protein n=1 Tax=Chrysophaeum taylorii TaxID=2483200 RepID=A0AAD7XIE3_9STRA|nr:hypothetical protein CTAYLR_006796 [Chrysophaeum taylorii]